MNNCINVMDEDSVDSETESRLVISTMDPLIKDVTGASREPTLGSDKTTLVEAARTMPTTTDSDSPPPSNNGQCQWNETTDPNQNCIYSAMEVNPPPETSISDNTMATLHATLSPPEQAIGGYEPEEGELEEGELEDDEETVEEALPEQMQKSPPMETPPSEKLRLKENEGSKKRPRDKDDDRRRKRRRHHKGPQSEDTSSKKHKMHYPKEEKEPDFDSLLKQELYLRGEASTPEVYQNEEEGETCESGSGEDWDKAGRKRHKRKRSSRSKSKSPSRKNEAICMFFLQGNCQKGKGCPYSHEMAPTRKLELCKFYMVDRCAKREKCLYMHKDFPCKYYHFGMKCVAGEDCKFSHSSLQEPAKNILCKHIESAPKDILGDFPRLVKNIAMSVLTLTLDKRNGVAIADEHLQSVLEVEGKGFKYVDRTLKEYRKRNGIDKAEKLDDKKKSSRDSDEKSPKKSSKSKHKDDNKEHERRSGKDRSKSGDKNWDGKDRDRDKDRYRNRGRDRRERPDRNRNRSDPSDPNNRLHKNPYPVAGTQRQRDFFQRIDNINQHQNEDDMSMQDCDQRDGHFDEQTKWYSSDEEYDRNDVNDRQGGFSPGDRRRRGEGNFPDHNEHNFPDHNEHNQVPDLKNIDFNYIQQLLNKVQPPNNSGAPENYDNSYAAPRDYESGRKPQQDFSVDPKETFEPKPVAPAAGSRNLTIDLQNLIKTAREKSAISDDPLASSRDDYPVEYPRDPRKSYPDSRQVSAQPQQDPRQSPVAVAAARQLSGDPRQLLLVGGGGGLACDIFPAANANSVSPMRRDQQRLLSRHDSGESWNSGQHSSGADAVDRGHPESYGAVFETQPPTKSRCDIDLRSGAPNLHSGGGDDRSDRTDRTESLLHAARVVCEPTAHSSSMYDIDLRQLDAISAAEINDITSLLQKMPQHTPAKEINGALNANPPVYYQLIEVTVPKPDFSHLRSIQADPRICDDPRLRLMFRMNSTEDQSPASPLSVGRKDSADYPPCSPDGTVFDRLATSAKESRDPRKQPQRDPRAEGKRTKAAVEPRVDPRVAARGDPRGSNSRDLLALEAHKMEEYCDPSMTGNVFMNGHTDIMQPNYGNRLGPPMPGHYAHMDPRGRPGLLGAAPPMNMQGGPGMHRSPYLLATPNIAPLMFGRDRDDMIMAPSGGMSKGDMWDDDTVAYKDPRVNRDQRQSY